MVEPKTCKCLCFFTDATQLIDMPNVCGQREDFAGGNAASNTAKRSL